VNLSHERGIRSSFEGWYAWHPGLVGQRHSLATSSLDEGETVHESLRRVCVAYLLRDHEGRRQVLLGRKKRGLGTGHFVGLGGKFEEGETEQDAIVREIEEESGVRVQGADLDRRGDLYYLFPHRDDWSQRSTVFVVTRWSGDPSPSDELDPVWFDLEALPLDEMWDDAKHWLPAVLVGGHVSHEFVFGPDLASVVGDRTIPSGSA
jgi:8-oxo-dGTP diphosphatase